MIQLYGLVEYIYDRALEVMMLLCQRYAMWLLFYNKSFLTRPVNLSQIPLIQYPEYSNIKMLGTFALNELHYLITVTK